MAASIGQKRRSQDGKRDEREKRESEELGSEHPCQVTNPAADRRLGHIHLARRRSKSARSCDGHKVA